MRYVPIRLERERRDEAYRIYLTDTLKIISENTAKLGGNAVSIRFYDIIHGGTNQKAEKTSEEIISELVRKGGIKIK